MINSTMVRMPLKCAVLNEMQLQEAMRKIIIHVLLKQISLKLKIAVSS